MNTRLLMPLMIASLCTPICAVAADTDSPWDATLWIGGNLTPATTLHKSTLTAVGDLGTVQPALTGQAGVVSTRGLSYHDAFRSSPQLTAELGFRSTEYVEPFVRLRYSDLRGSNDEIGRIDDAAANLSVPIVGDFQSLKTEALDVGAKCALPGVGALAPFVSAYVGVNHGSDLRARIQALDLQADLGSQTLLPATTRMEAGVDAGIDYSLAEYVLLRFSVGANYVNADNATTTALAPLGLPAIEVRGQRWTVPAAIGVTYRF